MLGQVAVAIEDFAQQAVGFGDGGAGASKNADAVVWGRSLPTPAQLAKKSRPLGNC